MKKRGLSPIIASILLVMLVLVLATIIFLWARGFISEQLEKFGQPVEQQCEGVEFEVELVDTVSGYDLEAVNYGNVPIGYLDIKKIRGGDEEVQSFKFFKMNPGIPLTEGIDIKMEDGSTPEEGVVYPVLLGSVKGKELSRPYTCVDKGQTITF
jgi:flagellin-like protein